MRIEVSVLSGYYERQFGHLAFWQSLVQSVWHWLCHKTEFAHRGGYYAERDIYSLESRWWWKKVGEYKDSIKPIGFVAPAFKIATRTIETRKRVHFSDCNQSVEIPITIKNLERAGKINTPELRAWAKGTIEDSKNSKRIDYEKHGHPNFDKDFKHPEFINNDD